MWVGSLDLQMVPCHVFPCALKYIEKNNSKHGKKKEEEDVKIALV
jgi:hypothetical protein